MKKEFEEFFISWNEINSQVGKDSNKHGSEFEKKCVEIGVPLIFKKLNLEEKNYEIFRNIKWEKKLGEIDILIREKGTKNNFIAIIECKARIFDIG